MTSTSLGPFSAASALLLGTLVAGACAAAEPLSPATLQPLMQEIEQLQHEALLLERDLTLLERELEYPEQTRVSVFLAVDVSRAFDLEKVEIGLGQTAVARVNYQPLQRAALLQGGVDRIYLGNLQRGRYRVRAQFTGKDLTGRPVAGEAAINVLKGQRPTLLLLQIVDSTDAAGPMLRIAEWAR